MTEYHVGNYSYLYLSQWMKNDYRLTVSLPLWAENFYHLNAEFYLLEGGGVGAFKSICKNVPRISPLVFSSITGPFLVPCKVRCFQKETALFTLHRNQCHLCSPLFHLITALAIPYADPVTPLFSFWIVKLFSPRSWSITRIPWMLF